MSEQTQTEQSYSDGPQWIVWPGGKRLGPFESVHLALEVRAFVEDAERREDLAIEPGKRS